MLADVVEDLTRTCFRKEDVGAFVKGVDGVREVADLRLKSKSSNSKS